MHLTVYQQSEIFYFAFVFGIALGFYYDIFRLLRYLGFSSKTAIVIQDMVFMSTASVMCFLFAQVTVNGRLRAFVVFSHLIGFFAYRFSIGMMSGFVFGIIGKIVGFISSAGKKSANRLIGISNKAGAWCVNKYSKFYDSFVKKSGEPKKFKTI